MGVHALPELTRASGPAARESKQQIKRGYDEADEVETARKVRSREM